MISKIEFKTTKKTIIITIQNNIHYLYLCSCMPYIHVAFHQSYVGLYFLFLTDFTLPFQLHLSNFVSIEKFCISCKYLSIFWKCENINVNILKAIVIKLQFKMPHHYNIYHFFVISNKFNLEYQIVSDSVVVANWKIKYCSNWPFSSSRHAFYHFNCHVLHQKP